MITDIDKHNVDRGEPQPNRHDQLDPLSVMARGTNSVNYTTPATNLSEISAAKNGQFTIVQTGKYTTPATITTSNPGAGLFAADNPLVYQVPHGLGFFPGVFAYEQNIDGSYTNMPYVQFAAQGGGANALFSRWALFADSNYVYIYLYTMTYGNNSWNLLPGFIFKWYLMQQTSN